MFEIIQQTRIMKENRNLKLNRFILVSMNLGFAKILNIYAKQNQILINLTTRQPSLINRRRPIQPTINGVDGLWIFQTVIA